VKAQNGVSKGTSKPMTTKIEQQSFSRPYGHFIKQLSSVTRKPPQKHGEKLEKLKPLIRWLKNMTGLDANRNIHMEKNDAKTQDSLQK
jgi:hypothetical protein